MKHIAQIQSEFLKVAESRWENLSYETQKVYIKRHPKTKRRITAQPVRGTKRLVRRAVDKLNNLTKWMSSKKMGKYGLGDTATRENLYSVLKKAIKGKDVKLPNADGWGIYDDVKGRGEVATELNKKVNRIVRSIRGVRNQLHRENMKKIKEEVEDL